MGSPPVAIGDVIADKYGVERAIGEGGMGVVYAARHRELDQRVAIKFLLPEIAQQGMAAERFRREARAAARIRGEHVCRVLDVGTLPGSGIPYMVMEYLEGRDLANELERRVRLPPEEAVGYILEACDAVAEAHAAGIVHRDIKPANLFLATRSDGSRHIKVLDFGVSKSLLDSSSGQHALTVTSSVVGSPLYMSPEQLDSARDVDRRTDIWALGVVLYELLTGNTPFRGDSIPQLVTSVLHDQPPSFVECEVTAPDGLEVVLARALAKPREQRYGSVAELVSALAPYAPRMGAVSMRMSMTRGIAGNSMAHVAAAIDSQPIVTITGAQESHKSPPPSAAPAPWTQRTTDRGRRSRQGAALAAMVVLIGAGFLFYRLASQSGSGEAGTPPVAAPSPAPVAAPAATPAAEPAKAAKVEEPAAPTATGAVLAPAPTPAPAAPNPPAAPATPPATSGARPPGAPAQPQVHRPRVQPAPAAVRPPVPAAPPSSPSQPGVSDFGGRR
jgi:eukaryotic-like serine/threonine-protein kinase